MKSSIWIAGNFLATTIWLGAAAPSSQRTVRYNLRALFDNNGLEYPSRQQVAAAGDDQQKDAIRVAGLVLLKGVEFSRGTIELDMHGESTLNESFLGIVFHAKDTTTYDRVYFRPFNFRNPDTSRRAHAVQYTFEPEYPWYKLRQEHPLVYEHPVTNPQSGDAWFHAKIVVDGDSCAVYYNHASQPSLKVGLLGKRTGGKIGLWCDVLARKGEYANLEITE